MLPDESCAVASRSTRALEALPGKFGRQTQAHGGGAVSLQRTLILPRTGFDVPKMISAAWIITVLTMPLSSFAETMMTTVVPEITVLPLAGAMIATVGGVVS